MILNQSHTAAPRTRRLSPHTRVHAQRQKSPRNPLGRHVTRCCGTANAPACPCPGAPRRASPGRLCSRASGSGGRCPDRKASAATPQGPAAKRSPGTQTCPCLPRAHFREDMLRLRCSEQAASVCWVGARGRTAGLGAGRVGGDGGLDHGGRGLRVDAVVVRHRVAVHVPRLHFGRGVVLLLDRRPHPLVALVGAAVARLAAAAARFRAGASGAGAGAGSCTSDGTPRSTTPVVLIIADCIQVNAGLESGGRGAAAGRVGSGCAGPCVHRTRGCAALRAPSGRASLAWSGTGAATPAGTERAGSENLTAPMDRRVRAGAAQLALGLVRPIVEDIERSIAQIA